MSVDVAKENYRKWHDKEPKFVDVQSYEFPSKVYLAGTMQYMIYESDKWEKDGDFHLYEHEFDSHPRFYVPGRQKSLKPTSKSRSTARLLCVDHLNDDVSLTMLAIVMEMVIKEAKTKKLVKYVFNEPPILAGTVDNKTLVIFSSRGPLFIKGGRMVITPRGIVH